MLIFRSLIADWNHDICDLHCHCCVHRSALLHGAACEFLLSSTDNYSHSLIVNTACALDCELLTGSECQIQRSCRGHEFECVLIEDAERNLQFHASELSDDYFLDFSKDTGTAQCLGHSLEIRQGDFPCQTHECCSVVVKVEVINNSGNT